MADFPKQTNKNEWPKQTHKNERTHNHDLSNVSSARKRPHAKAFRTRRNNNTYVI